MPSENKAARRGPGGRQWTSDSYRQLHSTIARQSEYNVGVYKRGRLARPFKVVYARPLGEYVLAQVYRCRLVQVPSLPLPVLQHARERRLRLWLVRLDDTGRCYELPLANVTAAGWLQPSEGRPEWFVPLDRFQLLPWQAWNYLPDECTLMLDELAQGQESTPQQLSLFGGVA